MISETATSNESIAPYKKSRRRIILSSAAITCAFVITYVRVVHAAPSASAVCMLYIICLLVLGVLARLAHSAARGHQ